MKKLLVCLCVVFLISCSNSLVKEDENCEYVPATQQERAMFGYDLDVVHEKEVNIKVKAKDVAELESVLFALEEIGVEKQRVEEAFVEGEWFVNAKVLGDYPKALKSIRSMNEVVYADPNYKVFFIDGWKPSPSDAVIHPFSLEEGNLDADPIADQKEYALSITEALRAYQEFGIGENEVWAGIIDTGTNANHEDMKYPDGKKVVQILKTAYSGSGIKIGDITDGNSDNEAPHAGGHGTHCSGTICAVGNNEKGIAGVAWKNVKLASYKGMKNGAGTTEAIYSSLRDLVTSVRKKTSIEKQATIPVNLSLGSPLAGVKELEHISYAMTNGALLVVANGNDGQMLATYPSAFPGVLSVGATGGNDKKIGFSTSGPWTNVCAPGVDIISLRNDSSTGYVYMSGTSMATPFVTGLVSYLLTFNPNLTPMQVTALLEATADKVDAANKDQSAKYNANGVSKWYGHGRVNVYRAAKAVKENNVPEVGTIYVETKMIVNVNYGGVPIYIYDKNTGDLVTITLATGTPAKAEIRGLRQGTYNVVHKGVTKEVSMTNKEDATVSF